jgi:hypothetical protein
MKTAEGNVHYDIVYAKKKVIYFRYIYRHMQMHRKISGTVYMKPIPAFNLRRGIWD